jgi:hypothetical protein
MTSNDAFGYAMAFTFGCMGVLLLVYAAWLTKELFSGKKK